MKQYIKFSNNSSEVISATQLADDFYGDEKDLRIYLKSLPIGIEITDIVIAPGAYHAGNSVVCEKTGGYKTIYYNRYGLPPSQSKYKEVWWELNGSETNEFDLAKIILKGTKFYCTRDVFQGDEF